MSIDSKFLNLFIKATEKAAIGATVMATSTRLFKGIVVEDSKEKKSNFTRYTLY